MPLIQDKINIPKNNIKKTSIIFFLFPKGFELGGKYFIDSLLFHLIIHLDKKQNLIG
ncbi:hypothetical protein MTBBW1_910005 [Desulfamplus magnetovallimortis]|uniref:Uncharacterized protein n=1 Tax=Desulfamplus magnetovallimortis TaxID=1246637 RepID=A0A1W1HKY1_9BACT|nr:hypothetical protein MTBBW1_910005 [Desulfamplus magnetovallimortis]